MLRFLITSGKAFRRSRNSWESCLRCFRVFWSVFLAKSKTRRICSPHPATNDPPKGVPKKTIPTICLATSLISSPGATLSPETRIWAQTRPPRLCATVIMGLSPYSALLDPLCSLRVEVELTEPSLARIAFSKEQRLRASLSILPCVTSAVSEWTTPESYPKLIIRLLGTSFARTSCGHITLFFVHVASRCPRRPWTKTMLATSR